jgi:hypothetical protein
MLSDSGITLAGHSVTMFQLLLAGGLLLGVAALLLAMARRKRVAIHRSVVTDEIAIHLSRIADAVDRLANETAARRQSEATRQVNLPPPPKLGEEAHPASFSIFGR